MCRAGLRDSQAPRMRQCGSTSGSPCGSQGPGVTFARTLGEPPPLCQLLDVLNCASLLDLEALTCPSNVPSSLRSSGIYLRPRVSPVFLQNPAHCAPC